MKYNRIPFHSDIDMKGNIIYNARLSFQKEHPTINDKFESYEYYNNTDKKKYMVVTDSEGVKSWKVSEGERGKDGLPGKQGAPGAPGKQGTQGVPGKSAYQIWLDAGNEGTEEDFLKFEPSYVEHPVTIALGWKHSDLNTCKFLKIGNIVHYNISLERLELGMTKGEQLMSVSSELIPSIPIYINAHTFEEGLVLLLSSSGSLNISSSSNIESNKMIVASGSYILK